MRKDFLPISRETTHFYLLSVSEYEIAATTGHSEDASTTENAWIVLEGRKARSKEFVLENKKKKFLRWVWLHRLNIVTRPLIISVLTQVLFRNGFTLRQPIPTEG